MNRGMHRGMMSVHGRCLTGMASLSKKNLGKRRKLRSMTVAPAGNNEMNSLFSGDADDTFTALGDIGFSFPFYGRSYRNDIYVGSNSYVTIGYSSSVYNGINYSSPGRGIFIDAGDRSLQGLLVKQELSGQIFRVRFVGSLGTSAASPANLVWEVTFFVEGVILIASAQGITNGYVTDGTGSNYTSFNMPANSSGVLTPLEGKLVYTPGSYG